MAKNQRISYISWCCSLGLPPSAGRRKGGTPSEPSGHITNIIGRATSLLSGANMFKQPASSAWFRAKRASTRKLFVAQASQGG